MNTGMRFLLLLLLMLPLLAGADVYKHVDERGVVTYSDSPQHGSQALELPEPSVYRPSPTVRRRPPAQGVPGGAERRPSSEQHVVDYRSVRILSPEHDATVRDNQGNVTVLAVTEPTLQEGHQIRLFINGKGHGEPQRNMTFRLTDLVRGEYQLKLRVFDARGRSVAESDSITFYLRQASRLN